MIFKKEGIGKIIHIHTVYDAPWYISSMVIKCPEDDTSISYTETVDDKDKVRKRGEEIDLIMYHADYNWRVKNKQDV